MSEEQQNTPIAGLNTDANPEAQPKGTYRYALNAVQGQHEGDGLLIGNESSNVFCAALPDGFVPIGHVYIGDGETCIFSVHSEKHHNGDYSSTSGQIGILSAKNTYTKLVEHADFNFRLSHPIRAIYRLRRNGEKFVYFTDNLNPIRFANLSNIKNHFFPSSEDVNVKSFSLLVDTNQNLSLSCTKVYDQGGQLTPGMYQVAVQIMASDGTPGQITSFSAPLIVYSNPVGKFHGNGSIHSGKLRDWENEETTYKSIFAQVSAGIEQNNHLAIAKNTTKSVLYRFILICYNAGDGECNEILATDIYDLRNKSDFLFTGNNLKRKLSPQDIAIEPVNISSAKYLTQIDNRLIVGNTTEFSKDLFILQKYASQICADAYLDTVKYNNEMRAPWSCYSKEFAGYMPGEVYAFGIRYLLSDNSYTPVFHIPGKNPDPLYKDTVFSPINSPLSSPPITFPMDNEGNTGTEIYTVNSNCDFDYWGVDHAGKNLIGNPVRFHRFPKRPRNTGEGLVGGIYQHFVEWRDWSFSETKMENRIFAYVIVDVIKQEKYKERPGSHAYTFYPLELVGEFYIEGDNRHSNGLHFLNGIPFKIGDFEGFEKISNSVVTNNGMQWDITSYAKRFDDFIFDNDLSRIIIFVDFITKGVSNYKKATKTVSLEKDVEQNFVNAVILDLGTEFNGNPSGIIGHRLRVMFYKKTVERKIHKKFYNIQPFGIKFSNIRFPTPFELNGLSVVGYQILRLPRQDEDKTVLDSCIISSVFPSAKENYTSNGLFLQRNIYSFISPDFKSNLPFANIDRMQDYAKDNSISIADFVHEYLKSAENQIENIIAPSYLFKQDTVKLPDSLRLEMRVYPSEINYDQFNIKDVVDGTSFKAGLSGGDPDNDGVQLSVLIRKWSLSYYENADRHLELPIERVFKLKSLESSYLQRMKKTLVNLSADNPAYFVQLRVPFEHNPVREPLLYGYLVSSVQGFYQDFLSRGYIPVTWSFQQEETCTCFGGDVYISPIRYVSTVFYDTITAFRKTAKVERAWWKELIGYVASGLLIIGGAVAAFFTAGTSLAVALGAVASGVVMGALTTKQTIAYYENKIMMDKMEALYTKEWANGLRDCVHDIVTSVAFRVGIKRDAVENESGKNILSDIYCDHAQIDDLIAWTGHVMDKFWFESPINLALRCKLLNTDIGFLDVVDELPHNGEQFAIQDLDRITRYLFFPAERDNLLHRYFQEKLTILNQTRKNTRAYLGSAVGEWYRINPDYQTENYVRKYYTLPKEYNFCAKEKELFPRRVYYSNQSFQEDLQDHYRVILANSYKDIEGSLGEITNLFTLQNNLFVHTSDGLWHLPQQYKERTAGDLVTVIGTGEYFSQPPVKMVDVFQRGAGCRHSFSLVKTRHGVFFISENDRKIYQFDGKQINPISDLGMSKWFEENLSMNHSTANFSNENFAEDNPYAPFGTGFIGVYDSENERVLFTKKGAQNYGEDWEWSFSYLCNGKRYYIPKYHQRLKELGVDKVGFTGTVTEDCKYKITYRRAIVEYRREKRTETIKETFYRYPGMVIYPAGDWDYKRNEYTEDPLVRLTCSLDEYNGLNNYNRKREFFPDPIGMSIPRQRNVQDNGLVGNYRSFPFINKIITIDEMVAWSIPKSDPFTPHREFATIYLFHPNGRVDADGFINGYLKDGKKPFEYWNPEFLQRYLKVIQTKAAARPVHCYILISPYDLSRIGVDRDTYLKSLGLQMQIFHQRKKLDENVHFKIKQILANDRDFKVYMAAFKNERLIPPSWGTKFKIGNVKILNSQLFMSNGFPQEELELFLEEERRKDVREIQREVEKEIPYVLGYEEGRSYTFDGVSEEQYLKNHAERWTISYSLKTGSWVSWHSYHPTFMFEHNGGFITAQDSQGRFYAHRNRWDFGIFYDKLAPFIIELVHLSDSSVSTWEDLTFKTVAKQYEHSLNYAKELPMITFNKALFYNANQTTELLSLKVKDQFNSIPETLVEAVKNPNYEEVYINKDEKLWHMNLLRNIWFTDNGMFNQTHLIQKLEGIDKKLDAHSLDITKDWFNLEQLRDTYLISRLFFDDHHIKLSVQLVESNVEESER